MNRARSIVPALCILTGGYYAAAQTPPKPQTPAEPTSSAKPQEPAVPYGKTPDMVIPYRSFVDPYTRFFQQVIAFRGVRSDEQGAGGEPVRIGFMAPLGDAPDGDLGQDMLDGVTLAIEQANVAGGYQGRPFELVKRPDSGLWGATSNQMVSFRYDDDVVAVIGSIDGGNTHIALRVALKVEMPMVNTGATDPTLTETNIPWILRCMADARQQGYAIAHHIFTECGIEKVAMFRVNNRFGRMGIGEFRDAARRLKHPLRVEMRWEPGKRDFTTQLDRIAETQPEAVFLWGDARDCAAVVREIRRRNMPVRIFGNDRIVSPTFLELAGEAAEGVVAVATYDPTRDDPKLARFVADYQARFQHAPGTFAAHAYDGTNILLAAIAERGPTRFDIRDALYEFKHYDGVTGPIEFDTTLNDIGPVYIATVVDGAFVYRPAEFTKSASNVGADTPYRTLAESAPLPPSPGGAPASVSEGLRIGCYLPLDESGESAVRGIRMALAEDAARRAGAAPIELLVRDSRALNASRGWGQDTGALTELVLSDEVLAVIGSTERRGTHLAEMMAAKFHFPVLSLCATDETITQIPLPWVFQVASESAGVDEAFARHFKTRFSMDADAFAAWGYDAGTALISGIRSGAQDRLSLRNAIASQAGAGGRCRFDALGNRIVEAGTGSLANTTRP